MSEMHAPTVDSLLAASNGKQIYIKECQHHLSDQLAVHLEW